MQVLYFNNNYAGVVLLVGQVADGLSTTLVGLLCDGRDNTWLCRSVLVIIWNRVAVPGCLFLDPDFIHPGSNNSSKKGREKICCSIFLCSTFYPFILIQ